MNSQEIFTPEERDENAKRKRELIELVASEEAVLIVGAGSSVRVGYPDWPCLLKKLEDLANECGDGLKPDEKIREEDPLTYAEDIKSHIYDKKGNLHRYHNLLYTSFARKTVSPDALHKKLVLLPFRGILTTNYDFVLEEALAATGQPAGPDTALVINEDYAAPIHEFLMAMIDTRVPRRIVHLHGRYDVPDSIILSRKDYQSAYEGTSNLNLPNENQKQRRSSWKLHRKLLWAILATRRVVFAGFSMRDPYLNEMLDVVSNDLWRWDKSTHYAIMGLSPCKSEISKATQLKSDFGIDTVFYEDFDNSHQGLDGIVTEIAERCNVEEQPAIEITEAQPARDEEALNWLEQMNQRVERRIDGAN